MATIQEILTRAGSRSGVSTADTSVLLTLLEYFNQISDLVMQDDWRWLIKRGELNLIPRQRNYIMPEDYLFLRTTVHDPVANYHWRIRGIERQFNIDPDEDYEGDIPDANVLLGTNSDGLWEIYFSPTPDVTRTVYFYYQAEIPQFAAGDITRDFVRYVPRYLHPAWVFGTAQLYLSDRSANRQALENEARYEQRIEKAKNLQRLQVKRQGGRLSRGSIRDREYNNLISDRPRPDLDFSG